VRSILKQILKAELICALSKGLANVVYQWAGKWRERGISGGLTMILIVQLISFVKLIRAHSCHESNSATLQFVGFMQKTTKQIKTILSKS
jgi:fido (protein-threonine AMPylation protein)